MKERLKRIAVFVCVLVLVLFGWRTSVIHSLDVEMANYKIQVGKEKTYHILNSTRWFEVYTSTNHQVNHQEAGGEVDFVSFSDTLYGNAGTWTLDIKSVKDGYRFTGWSVSWGKYSVSEDGRRLTIKADGKNAGNATANFEFVGFSTSIDLGSGGIFNTSQSSVYAQQVPYGVLSVPDFTLKPGYTFSGWSSTLDVASSKTITPNYLLDVTIDTQDGTEPTLTRVTQGSSISHPGTPVRTGYNFLGWYDNQELTQRADFTQPIQTPKVYYASWEAAYYTLVLDGNEGVFSGSSPKREVQFESVLGELHQPTRAGYHFLGWNTGADGLGQSYSSMSLMPNHALTLYAQWDQDVYAVTFDGNGALSPAMQSKTYGQFIDEPDRPSKEGYEFLGWQAIGESSLWDFNRPVSASVELQAQWREIRYYDVTFESAGGSLVNGYTHVLENSLIDQPETPLKSGYTFLGWFDSNNTRWDFGTSLLTQSLELRAHWQANQHTVDFDGNGSWNTLVRQIHGIFNETVHEPSVTPKRFGYAFIGWTFNDQFWNFMNALMPDQDLTLTARYEAKTYTVSFIANAQNVSGLPASMQSVYQSQVTVPLEQPSREGYRFAGWNTQADGAGQSFNEVFANGMVGGDVRLYAQWEK